MADVPPYGQYGSSQYGGSQYGAGSQYGGSQYGGDGYDYQNLPSPRPSFAGVPQLHRTGSEESLSYRARNMSGYPPSTSPDQYYAFQRIQSTRHDPSMMVQRGMTNVSHATSAGWLNPQYNRREHGGRAYHYARRPERGDQESREIQIYTDLDHMSDLSMRDSGVGSDMASRHRTASNATSAAPPEYPRGSIASDESFNEKSSNLERERSTSVRTEATTTTTSAMATTQPREIEKDLPPPPRTQSITSSTTPTTTSKDHDLSSDSEDGSSRTSRAASPAASTVASKSSRPRSETESISRAIYAPEVVTKEYESMFPQQVARANQHSKRTPHLAPVLRKPFNYVDSPPGPSDDPEDAWHPLPRPARHNNYHGFCKGAWQIRKSVSTSGKQK